MNTIINYLPTDRRHALVNRQPLADRSHGAALFADIAGFTPATDMIAQSFGSQRGAEELLVILNHIYRNLIEQVDRYGGSTINFAGDSITIWFDDHNPPNSAPAFLRAAACALAMREAMEPFREIALPNQHSLSLSLKTSIAAGVVRRMLVGNPSIQLIEVLAGTTIERLGAVAAATKPDEILLDSVAFHLLAPYISVKGWRSTAEQENAYAILDTLHTPLKPQPWPELPDTALDDEQLRPWVLEPVYSRLHNGYGEFLAELRYTVSLFVQFAMLDYDHDPQAEAQLNAFVNWVQAVLEQYAGWLVQVSIGDKGSYLYATFGAPIAHDDDAARAVAAALELRNPPPHLAAFDGIRIGISAGQSRAGALGAATRTYNVMGAATNLAARLMEAAQPGQVLISANLAPALHRRYLLEQLPPIVVKGKHTSIPIMMVQGEQNSEGIHLQEPQYTLPLVGRSAEMATIEAQIAATQQEKGRVIQIIGDPGMGKSRLVAEIIQRTSQVGFNGLAGAGQSTTTQTAYYAWQPIWRSFFRLSATPQPDELPQLQKALSDLNPTLLATMPLLGPLLAIPCPDNETTRNMDAKQRKESLEQLLVNCLQAYAANNTTPLLFVVEDAHWLDTLSLDLLHVICAAIEKLPMLLVVTQRPNFANTNASLQALPNAIRLTLNELSANESQQLIAYKLAISFGSAHTLPQTLADTIIARAEGNPFYIEELLNYIHDQNREFSTDIEQLELPSSLASLIMSRIDRLTTEQQTTLKVASVIGRIFPVDWLWGVLPTLGSTERVLRDLEQLARLDITPLNTPDPELTYLFKHATTQEVAYASLPFGLRAQLHGQLAAWLERRTIHNPPLDLLAYHYGLSDNRAKQREYFQKAGDEAAARYANQTALNYYERLMELLPPHKRLANHIAIGKIYEHTNAWEAAEAQYQAVLSYPAQPSDMPLRAQAQIGLGSCFLNRARYDEAMEWYQQALQTFEALGDQAGQSEALFHMGRIHWFRGDAEATRPLIERSLQLAGPNANRRFIANAYEYLGNIALSQEDYRTASDWWERSLAIRRMLNDKRGIASSLGNLAIGAYTEGRYNEAYPMINESVMLFHEIGARAWYGFTRVFQALILAQRGDARTAQHMQIENLELLNELEALPLMYLNLIGLAQATQLAEGSIAAHEYAIKLVGAAIKVHEEANSQRYPYDQAIADQVIHQARQYIEPTRFDELWEEGYRMPWREAITFALAYAKHSVALTIENQSKQKKAQRRLVRSCSTT